MIKPTLNNLLETLIKNRQNLFVATKTEFQ